MAHQAAVALRLARERFCHSKPGTSLTWSYAEELCIRISESSPKRKWVCTPCIGYIFVVLRVGQSAPEISSKVSKLVTDGLSLEAVHSMRNPGSLVPAADF